MNQPEVIFSEKYITKNPISRRLINGYIKSLKRLVKKCDFQNILDIGCGEGIMLMKISDNLVEKEVIGIDLSEENISSAKKNFPPGKFQQGSGYKLGFNDNTFDLVTCLEVLEHMDTPEKAIEEIYRVSKRYAILSVPNEPLWRILNMARFKYWKDLGNTPDHVNHWSRNNFIGFVGEKFEIIEVEKPIPWTMLLCKKK
jgi:ubiquinone/menaquinone biosynthesis C-methylase UbiE